MAGPEFEDALSFYPYGVQYYRAPTPLPDEWGGDFREIARAGYTHVQFRPQWRWHERVRGEYYWDDLDRLFELAYAQQLRVVLKPLLETAPDWVFGDLNAGRVGFAGRSISPMAISSYYVGGWLPCFDHPQCLEAALHFTRTLVERYRDHPALWFYNAWNEPRSRPLDQCQCEHSQASYRRWLTERYGGIEAINARFGKAWESIDSIQPPQAPSDYAELFLWRTWASQAVADPVRDVARVIQEASPGSFVMSHVGGCSVIQDPAGDASDDIAVAQAVDRYGTSFPVPLHPATPIEQNEPNLISDWMRRVDERYWCHEFYTNHANWSQPPEPRTLERLIWLAIAGGGAGFTFWQYRSERVGTESNGWGMREIDGAGNERSRVCDAIAQVLREHGPKLIGSRTTRAATAMVYSRDSDLLSRIEIMPEFGPAFTNQPITDAYHYKQALKSTHARLRGCGIETDFVVPGDDLAHYQLVVIPAAEMIDTGFATQLHDYVEQGGQLIIEFPFACRTDNTWVSPARPAHGLSTLLGCSEDDRRVVDKDAPPVATFSSGLSVPAHAWRINFALEGGEATAFWPDGRVAAVRHALGQGQVFSLSSGLCLSGGEKWEEPGQEVLREMLRAAQVCPTPGSGPGLWVRKRRGPGCEVWFVFSLDPGAKEVTLPAAPRAVWYSTRARIDGKILSFTETGCCILELET